MLNRAISTLNYRTWLLPVTARHSARYVSGQGRFRNLFWANGYSSTGGSPRPQTEPQETPTKSEAIRIEGSVKDNRPPEPSAIQMPAGDAAAMPTESEQDIVADRSEKDPLAPKKSLSSRAKNSA